MPRAAVRRLRRARNEQIANQMSAALEDGSYDAKSKTGRAVPVKFSSALSAVLKENRIPLVVCIVMFVSLVLFKKFGYIGGTAAPS